jgi:hypothetical protein
MPLSVVFISERVNAIRLLADKTAIGLSLLCSLHCLALPVAAALLPSLVALGLPDEAFHLWMVIGVIPISALALTLGCRAHRNFVVMAIGVTGLSVLCVPLLMGHELLGEWGERLLTLLGAFCIAISHYRNFRLCQNHSGCECVS